MGVIVKKVLVILTVFFLFPLTATAAERPTTVAGCATPTSKAHTPATVKQPKTADKKLAKTMTITTNCGVIKIAMTPAAPQTVTNMSALARAKYFDKSFCHRLTTEGLFVLQCGDPAGDGTGSPGFSFADENLPTAGADGNYIYPRGTVAMANSGPNTNGSQFFLVYQDSPLPPNYSVWGNITKGIDVLDNVASAGVLDGSSDGLPSQAVVISKASTTP